MSVGKRFGAACTRLAKQLRFFAKSLKCVRGVKKGQATLDTFCRGLPHLGRQTESESPRTPSYIVTAIRAGPA